jgi:Ca-activated chloride channel homolog
VSARAWRLWAAAVLAVLLTAAVVQRLAPRRSWGDLWRTPDQQGQAAFDRGDFALAAERYADPRRRGAACYRAGDLACAIDAWARFGDADAEYNLGNATLRAGELDTALVHYDRALQLRPAWPAATHNRALAQQLHDAALAKKRDKARRRPGEKGDDDAEPETRSDEARDGKPGEMRVQKLAPGDADAIWMRNVQTDPAAFLRRRFAAELDTAARKSDPGAAPSALRPAAPAAAPSAPRAAVPAAAGGAPR